MHDPRYPLILVGYLFSILAGLLLGWFAFTPLKGIVLGIGMGTIVGVRIDLQAERLRQRIM